VRRWIERWNAYWFPETSTLSLAVIRIIAVGAQLFWFFPPLHNQLVLLEKNSHFMQPQMLIRIVAAIVPRELLFTPRAFTIFYWAVVAAGFAALLGLLTRLSLFVFALGVWIIMAHWYSYGDFHHESAVFCIFLLLLAFTPAGSRLSLDALIRRHRGRPAPDTADTAIWPLKVAHVLLALTYFTAGIAKVVVGGADWVNGYTLQNYVFSDAIARGFPFGMWLAQQHTISIALSVFTLIFELCFFLSLVLPWTAPIFFLTGIGFHIGLYLAAGHDFFSHMVLLFLLLLFIQPEWLRAWLGSHVAVRRGLQSRPALT
jgi:vitamin K-dependent gamma-carboxylase-like protein